MRRRDLIGGLVVAAGAVPTLAWGAAKSVPLTKAFAYLDAFFAYPAAKRSRFYITFVARRGAKPAPDFKAVIVGPGAARAPLALDRTGRVLNLPTLGQLHSSATLDTDDTSDVKLGIELHPVAAPALHVDPNDLNVALLQASAAITSIAGAMSFMVPKFDSVYFLDAGAGQAVFAGGRATPLPITSNRFVGPTPYFTPGANPGARDVVLQRAPSRMLMLPHPKT